MAFDLSNVAYLEITSRDYAGKQLKIVSSERVDTGEGALKPLMSLPTELLGILGTPAVFHMAGQNSYDPATGKVTSGSKTTVSAMIYAEAYTARECADIPNVLQGDVKVYAPGQAWGYETTALLQMQVREILR
jgi:hypothetical protein